jgi:hypothetical protein
MYEMSDCISMVCPSVKVGMGPHMAEPLRDEIKAVVHSCPIHLEESCFLTDICQFLSTGNLLNFCINKHLRVSSWTSKKESLVECLRV